LFGSAQIRLPIAVEASWFTAPTVESSRLGTPRFHAMLIGGSHERKESLVSILKFGSDPVRYRR
jgi:hypothetical protein